VIRTLLILLPLAVALVATGCDSNADRPAFTEAELVGTWDVERASVSVAGIPSPNLLAALQTGDRAEITFQSRGLYTFTLDVEEPRTVNVAVPGTNQSFPLTIDDSSFEGTYSVESDTRMRFGIGGVPGEAEVEVRYRTPGGRQELTLVVRNTDTTRALLAYLLGSEELAALVSGGEVTLRKSAAAGS